MSVLVALNWDFLTEESDGIAILVTLSILTTGTLVFYFLTGVTDPGYVRNQIFANQYETTDFFEEEEINFLLYVVLYPFLTLFSLGFVPKAKSCLISDRLAKLLA